MTTQPRMTYEEACKLLGYNEPPDLSQGSRKVVINTATRLSENGTKPIDLATAHLCRVQIEMFG